MVTSGFYDAGGAGFQHGVPKTIPSPSASVYIQYMFSSEGFGGIWMQTPSQ